MIRRLLWQRAFKCDSLIRAIVIFLLFTGVAIFGFYRAHPCPICRELPLIQDKRLCQLLPFLASVFVVLAWGVAGILKADICRSSTSMIPGFRRKLLNFFLSFGVILSLILLLFSLNPLWGPFWLRHLSLILPLGLFLFGISLFLSHIWPDWIIFAMGLLVPVGFLRMLENYPPQFGFLEPLSAPLLLISPFIIWGYRTMMLKINEDHCLYGTRPFPGFGTSLREMTKRGTSLTAQAGDRWGFEHSLKLCRYKKQLGRMFLPSLIVLRNSGGLPNPLVLTFLVICFSSLPTALLGLALFFAVAGTVSGIKLPSEKFLPLEIVKPLSRNKLFLSEYLSYYFRFLIIFLLFWLGISLQHYNPLYYWLEGRIRPAGFLIPLEFSLLIAGSFFLISFLALFIIRRASQKNLFWLSIIVPWLTLTLAWLSRIIGLLPILAIFSTLTVLFLVIAFRLDCRKDI